MLVVFWLGTSQSFQLHRLAGRLDENTLLCDLELHVGKTSSPLLEDTFRYAQFMYFLRDTDVGLGMTVD